VQEAPAFEGFGDGQHPDRLQHAAGR
jgi:hypothetical protein